MKRFSCLFSLLFLLHACAPPVYQETTYGLDDFIADSCQISQGKWAILNLEQQACLSQQPLHQPYDETVMEGDELTIAVHHPSRQDHVSAFHKINHTAGFRVSNGQVCLPQVGSIRTAGMTLRGLKETVGKAYQQQVPGGKIYIDYKKKRERYVQIIGARKSMIPVNGKMRLNEVLAKAGIPPTSNLFKSYVMRDGQQLPVDLYQLIHEGNEDQNIVMHGGDQIFVAQASDASVMVTGEVLRPTVIPAPYGFLHLREAIAIAGGISFTGDQTSIGIIRGDLIHPKVYCLNWQEIKHMTNKSLLLMPGDVVVVSERPITQWNRFINQMQPSTSGMQAGYDIYEMWKETH